jgi:hypothetical protein
VAIFGREDHVLDGRNLAGSELAGGGSRTWGAIVEAADKGEAAPCVVAGRRQADDSQNEIQGQGGQGARDRAQDAGLGLALGQTLAGETESGGRRSASKSLTVAAKIRARVSSLWMVERSCSRSCPNASRLTTERGPRRFQLEIVERGTCRPWPSNRAPVRCTCSRRRWSCARRYRGAAGSTGVIAGGLPSGGSEQAGGAWIPQ